MACQAMRDVDKEQWVDGDGTSSSQESLMHEAA
jgi:hypothetical protein